MGGAGGAGGIGGLALVNDGGVADASGGDGGLSGDARALKREVNRRPGFEFEADEWYFTPPAVAQEFQLSPQDLVAFVDEVAILDAGMGGAGGVAGSLDGASEDGEDGEEGASETQAPIAIADAGVGGLGATGGLAFAIGSNAVALARNTGLVGGGFALAAGESATAEGGAGVVRTAPGDEDGIALSLPQAAFLLYGDAGYYNDLSVSEEDLVTGGFYLGVAGAGGGTGSSGSALADEYGDPAVVEAGVEAEVITYAVGAGFGATENGDIEGGAAAGSTLIGLTAGGIGMQEGETVSGYGAADSKTIRYAQGEAGVAEVDSTGDASGDVEVIAENGGETIIVDASVGVESETLLEVGGPGILIEGMAEADAGSELMVGAGDVQDGDVSGVADSETNSDADITFETPTAYAFRSNTRANAGDK